MHAPCFVQYLFQSFNWIKEAAAAVHLISSTSEKNRFPSFFLFFSNRKSHGRRGKEYTIFGQRRSKVLPIFCTMDYFSADGLGLIWRELYGEQMSIGNRVTEKKRSVIHLLQPPLFDIERGKNETRFRCVFDVWDSVSRYFLGKRIIALYMYIRTY